MQNSGFEIVAGLTRPLTDLQHVYNHVTDRPLYQYILGCMNVVMDK